MDEVEDDGDGEGEDEMEGSSPGFDQHPGRARLVRLFEQWLDDALAHEEAPRGVAAELLAELESEDMPEAAPDRRADLFSLWAAMTTLSQEVRLQGRAFRQLDETLRPLADRHERSVELQEQALAEARDVAARALRGRQEREQEIAREVRERALRETFDLLLDLRDRLARSVGTAAELIEQARRRQAGRVWARLRPGAAEVRNLTDALTGLEQGSRLALARLDDALDQQGVSRMACQGQLFDPHAMIAVELDDTTTAADGTVLEVHRPGYEWRDEVLRPAQVKVARRPGRHQGEDVNQEGHES